MTAISGTNGLALDSSRRISTTSNHTQTGARATLPMIMTGSTTGKTLLNKQTQDRRGHCCFPHHSLIMFLCACVYTHTRRKMTLRASCASFSRVADLPQVRSVFPAGARGAYIFLMGHNSTSMGRVLRRRIRIQDNDEFPRPRFVSSRRGTPVPDLVRTGHRVGTALCAIATVKTDAGAPFVGCV